MSVQIVTVLVVHKAFAEFAGASHAIGVGASDEVTPAILDAVGAAA